MALYPEDVPFNVVKENWFTWDLGNDCILKIKLVLGKILKPPSVPLEKVENFNLQHQAFTIVTAPLHVKGSPETRELTKELLDESIIEDIDPKPLAQDGNEYTLENGTIIRLKLMLLRVARTDIFSADGTPVYVVQHQIVPQLILPKKKKVRRPSNIV